MYSLVYLDSKGAEFKKEFRNFLIAIEASKTLFSQGAKRVEIYSPDGKLLAYKGYRP